MKALWIGGPETRMTRNIFAELAKYQVDVGAGGEVTTLGSERHGVQDLALDLAVLAFGYVGVLEDRLVGAEHPELGERIDVHVTLEPRQLTESHVVNAHHGP